MDTIDISKLNRDPAQNNLYDLFIQTFNKYDSYLNYLIVDKKYEMRLDYLCKELYGDISYIGMLMKLNDIFNPFSIKEGDMIVYIPSNRLTDSLFTDPKTLQLQAKKLISTYKSSNIDNNRSSYLNKLKIVPKLPPIIDNNGSPKNVVTDSSIKIAPTLFTKPEHILNTDSNGLENIFSTTITTTNGTGNTAFDQTSNGNLDQSETVRILVNTFIRSNNAIITTDKTNNSTNDN